MYTARKKYQETLKHYAFEAQLLQMLRGWVGGLYIDITAERVGRSL